MSEPLTDNAGAYRVLIMGNSHAAALHPVLTELLALGQLCKTVDVQRSSSASFLDARVNDGFSEQRLESHPWTHANGKGGLLTGLVFYPVITGQPVESLPQLSAFGVDVVTESTMKEAASEQLFVYPPYDFAD